MLFAGFNVSNGEYTLAAATAAGVLGNLVGSWIAYWVGRAGRVDILEKHGRKLHIKKSHLEWADRWFERHGDATVFFARMLPIIRTFISLPAGVARMPFWRFTDPDARRLHPVGAAPDVHRQGGRRQLGVVEGQPPLRGLRGAGDDRGRRRLAHHPRQAPPVRGAGGETALADLSWKQAGAPHDPAKHASPGRPCAAIPASVAGAHARATRYSTCAPFSRVRRRVRHRRGRPTTSHVGWFADDDLRAALATCMPRLVRARTLLLPRVDAWQAAPELVDAMVGRARRGGGPQRAWTTLRGASLIACPVRGEFGSRLGALVVASVDRRHPLGKDQLPTVEALADLAAISLERTSLLEAEGRRARDELRLKRAAEEISGTLDPAEVYVRVAEHAAAICGGTCALLTRLSSRAGETRTAAARPLHGRDRGPARVARQQRVRPRRAHARTRCCAAGPTPRRSAPSCTRRSSWARACTACSPSGTRSPGRFGEDDLELLVKLARSSAAAIANAIDYQRERRIARALTLGFVPESLPKLPGLRDGPPVRARRQRGHGRRRLRRLAGRRRRQRGGAGGRRGRQGRGDRRAQRDGALLHRGAQLGLPVPGARCSSRRTPCCSAGSRATRS